MNGLLCILILIFQNNEPSAEIYYYPNHKPGSYTVPIKSMVRQYQKKASINDKIFVDAWMKKLMDLPKIECKNEHQQCDLVVSVKTDQTQDPILIGFDFRINIVYLDNQCYIDNCNLYRLIKRKCKLQKKLPKRKMIKNLNSSNNVK